MEIGVLFLGGGGGGRRLGTDDTVWWLGGQWSVMVEDAVLGSESGLELEVEGARCGSRVEIEYLWMGWRFKIWIKYCRLGGLEIKGAD